MTIGAVADGHYRIRKAGANSEIANQISNGKKCHYVQIGVDLFDFANLEDAKEFVEGKGLVPDERSLDFGEEKTEPSESTAETNSEDSEAETDAGKGDEVA